MTRAISRLALRIYWVSLAQLLAIVAAVTVVGWLTFNPRRGVDFSAHARYLVDHVVAHGADPGVLRAELSHVRTRLHLSISIYGPDRQPIASGVEPSADSTTQSTVLASAAQDAYAKTGNQAAQDKTQGKELWQMLNSTLAVAISKSGVAAVE